MKSVITDLVGASKRYGSVQALRDISFEVARGDVLAVVGENGAGKSTLVGVSAGSVAPDKGHILVDGQHGHFNSPLDAKRLGVQLVPQELQLRLNLTIAQNISLAATPRRAWGGLDRGELRRIARARLARLNLDLDVDLQVGRQRVVEQALVQIARAFADNTRVLIVAVTLDQTVRSLER